MTENERFIKIHIGTPYEYVIKDINNNETYGMFKGDDKAVIQLLKTINELNEENEELKKQLSDCKKDEKQLSISFMEFKMQLIEVLQQNYNYAYNQRQKNLDKSIVARNYEVLYQTIDNIAETMNVDIERFPKR